MELPRFIYHPDPIATGMIKREQAVCPCCEQAVDHIYAHTPYCEEEVENLCPWCIANGSAAKKYDALFSDDSPLIRAGLKTEIIDEVIRRTPSFISWQQEEWLSCCDDACQFHGDLEKDELLSLPTETTAKIRGSYGFDDDDWIQFRSTYKPGGSPAIYKFVCRHCHAIMLGTDCH